MKFHWKLLLAFLIVALLPLYALRVTIKDANEELAHLMVDQFALGVSMGGELQEDISLPLKEILLARAESEMLAAGRRTARIANDRLRLIQGAQDEQMAAIMAQLDNPADPTPVSAPTHTPEQLPEETSSLSLADSGLANAVSSAGVSLVSGSSPLEKVLLKTFARTKEQLPRLMAWQSVQGPWPVLYLYPALPMENVELPNDITRPINRAMQSAAAPGDHTTRIRTTVASTFGVHSMLTGQQRQWRDSTVSVVSLTPLDELIDVQAGGEALSEAWWTIGRVEQSAGETQVIPLARHAASSHDAAPMWEAIDLKQDLHQRMISVPRQAAGNGCAALKTVGHEDNLQACFDLPEFNLVILLSMAKATVLHKSLQAERFVSETIWGEYQNMAVVIFALATIIILLSVTMSQALTRRMTKLSRAFEAVSLGDFSVRVSIRGKDEVAQLGSRFNSMVPALKDQVRLKQDVLLAHEIQKSLLPEPPACDNGVDVAGTSIAHDETGGDYYDFFSLPNGETGAIIGDVTGHGLPAALLMTTARAFVRSSFNAHDDLGSILTKTNDLLACDVQMSGRSMTAFLCAVDPEKRSVRWSRAGHDPALVYLKAEDTFDELDGDSGLPLGILEGHEYIEQAQHCPAETIILFGSDGLWETRGSDGTLFGKDRLRAIMKENAHRTAQEILETTIAAVLQFGEETGVEDDLTGVVIKFA